MRANPGHQSADFSERDAQGEARTRTTVRSGDFESARWAGGIYTPEGRPRTGAHESPRFGHPKRNKKRNSLWTLLGVCAACAADPAGPTLRGFAIADSPRWAVEVGESRRLPLTYSADVGADRAVRWTSDHPAVAVDQSGVITGLAPTPGHDATVCAQPVADPRRISCVRVMVLAPWGTL